MRRPVSLVLALILAVSSAVVSSPHVHAYDGHDHPEHRHGPASHGDDHHHAARPTAPHDHHDLHDAHDGDGVGDGGRFHFEACDAGDHVVRLPASAAPLPQSHIQFAVVPMSIAVVPAISGRLAAAPIDVRVHGPPSGSRLPARAPPLTFPA